MKGATTIQERLWELRKDKGLNLEELSRETGISKSALASYESDDNKEINHGSLIALADFYQVSIDYLFCRTENRDQINTPLSELHLTDEAVELLKSGRINNRLLCEIATNDKFEQLMTDTEIYIDGHATSTFRTLYESLEEQRQTIVQKYKQADSDFYSQTLLAAEVKEEDFFCHVTHKTWDAILHDIRTTPLQRRWVWKSEKPFNPPGTISEKCGQLFLICSAWIFISCPLMNRKHSKRFCQNHQLSKTARSTSGVRENENSRCGLCVPATAVLS